MSSLNGIKNTFIRSTCFSSHIFVMYAVLYSEPQCNLIIHSAQQLTERAHNFNHVAGNRAYRPNGVEIDMVQSFSNRPNLMGPISVSCPVIIDRWEQMYSSNSESTYMSIDAENIYCIANVQSVF